MHMGWIDGHCSTDKNVRRDDRADRSQEFTSTLPAQRAPRTSMPVHRALSLVLQLVGCARQIFNASRPVFPRVVDKFWVILAKGSHPFPSRIRKLSPSAPMVLHARVCGRVGRRPIKLRKPQSKDWGFLYLEGLFNAVLRVRSGWLEGGNMRAVPGFFPLRLKKRLKWADR